MDVIYRYDPYAPLVTRKILDSQAAIDTLIEGNDRLIHLVERMQERTFGAH